MSVTEVKLSSAGCGGKASGNAGSQANLEFTAHYNVKAASTDTAYEVLEYFRTNGSLPWIGSQFAYSQAFTTDAVCVDIDAQPIANSGGRFVVSARYQSPNADDGNGRDKDGNNTDDPLLWHDEIDISTTQVSMPIEYATYIGPAPANEFLRPGLIIRDPCNSAGVPFDPLPEYELDITILRITKYAAGWDDAMIAPYRGTINSDLVQINKPDYNFRLTLPPIQGKIKQWSGSFHFQNKVKYWKQTIELHINPLGWRFPLLDRGTTKTEIDDDPESDTYQFKVPKRIVDADGVPLTEPQKLDGNGKLLRAGLDPVYLLYGKYTEVPYANIIW